MKTAFPIFLTIIISFIMIASCTSCAINEKNFIKKQNNFPTESFFQVISKFNQNGKLVKVGLCSGWALSKDKENTIGITNKHCIESDKDSEYQIERAVLDVNNNYYPLVVIKTNEKSDLAAIKIIGAKLQTIKVFEGNISPGTIVWAMGTPAGFENFSDRQKMVPIIMGVYNGKYSPDKHFFKDSKIKRMWTHFSIPITGGSSGSAVLAKVGNYYYVISVLHTSIILRGDYNNFSCGVILEDLIDFTKEFRQL
jgi:V8-like Glu-specific endopeptidase